MEYCLKDEHGELKITGNQFEIDPNRIKEFNKEQTHLQNQ